jgi:GH15 family glucan-1,4-alpha-glucosidase
VDGKFEWIDGDWDAGMAYMPETLTGRYRITQPQTGVEMEINDAIHHTQNIFLRKVKIVNHRDYPLKIRLFFTHDFHINGYEAGDTAFFDHDGGLCSS